MKPLTFISSSTTGLQNSPVFDVVYDRPRGEVLKTSFMAPDGNCFIAIVDRQLEARMFDSLLLLQAGASGPCNANLCSFSQHGASASGVGECDDS